MIKFNELRVGDNVIADNDGDKKAGQVTNLNGDEKQVCVDTGAQEFWYETDQLYAIPLDEAALTGFKFSKQVNDDNTIKYLKGAFRILIPKEGDFSRLEIWYRDETRHMPHPISVHTLQNHFYEMTKVHLDDQDFN